MVVGLFGLAAVQAAGSLHNPWLSRWLPPESHVASGIFSCFWIAGLISGCVAYYYLAQAEDAGGRKGGAA
jgi:lipid-A-disaccharide synthase-like uncharacterized protein